MILAFIGPMVAIIVVSNTYIRTITIKFNVQPMIKGYVTLSLYNIIHVGECCAAEYQLGVVSQVPVWENVNDHI